MSDTALRAKLIRLAHSNPELRSAILPLVSGTGRTAAWENLPEGWTDESVQSFWDSLTGDVKHKITKCMTQMEGKVTDTGAFCGSLGSAVGYRAASARTAEWKGWTEDMPVQVVTTRGTEVFPNLAAAKLVYPTLDPRHNTRDFTWATRGEVKGRPAIRFEDWATERLMSMAASTKPHDATMLRRAAIRVAHEDPAVRAEIVSALSR